MTPGPPDPPQGPEDTPAGGTWHGQRPPGVGNAGWRWDASDGAWQRVRVVERRAATPDGRGTVEITEPD